MKNLANCKPSEFLVQTNKIRKVAEDWLDATQIAKIRKIKPTIPDGVSEEEKVNLVQAQVKRNFSAILDAVLEDNAGKTLELLALICFVEPEKVDDHPIDEYIAALAEIIGNKSVIRFFISLVQLGQTGILS